MLWRWGRETGRRQVSSLTKLCKKWFYLGSREAVNSLLETQIFFPQETSPLNSTSDAEWNEWLDINGWRYVRGIFVINSKILLLVTDLYAPFIRDNDSPPQG